MREIPLDRQRLLFNNQILQPDNSPIYWIAGIGPDCQIHLVENNPRENNYRSIAQVDFLKFLIVTNENYHFLSFLILLNDIPKGQK